MKQLILSALIFIGIMACMTYFINTTQAGRRCDERVYCEESCNVPTTTPSPTDDPQISTPSATPYISPTNGVLTENRVSVPEPTPDGSKSAPTCDITIPNKPDHIVVDSGVHGDGSLTLLWPHIVNATHINLYYGEYGKSFEHGISNYPDDGHIDIHFLKNTNYNFCIEGVNRCAVGPMLCVDPMP